VRIVFVAWRDLAHPYAGGSEVLVDNLASELSRRGHEVVLVCGGPVGERPYPVVDAGGTFAQYLRAPLIARRYRDWDLLVDVHNGIGFASPLWWRRPRLSLFHHLHEEQWHQYFPPLVARAGSFFERRLMPRLYRSTPFVTVSASSAADLERIGVHPDAIHVTFNGVSPALLAEPEAASQSPLFVALGRLTVFKGVDRVLAAWPAVRAATGGRLVIIGDGPERDKLRAIASEGVELAGRASDDEKRQLLGEAWLLVHGAHHEGWGIAIIEAAAQCTPAIGFDVAGVRDAIIDGETGVLVDTPTQLTQAWLELAEDAERREKLGRRARERAQAFTVAASTDAFLEAARVSVELGRPRNEHPKGLRRSAKLLRLYRKEPTDPRPFYDFLARDTLVQLAPHGAELGGAVVDVGGGPGYFANAVRAAGGRCVVVEYLESELRRGGGRGWSGVVGDGQAIPLRDGCADVAHCSNVLEHVPAPEALLAELVRIVRPGGVGYLSFTPWLSPWGGHETSPWHYLGGERAGVRFRSRTGRDPVNQFGVNLFTVHVAAVSAWFAGRRDVEVLWEGPRYWPPAWHRLSRAGKAGEVLTWNLAVIFRRVGPR
jgi:glycosyltransferase involved in cell wall biosynthesis/SAM-dependent methyltransferase